MDNSKPNARKKSHKLVCISWMDAFVDTDSFTYKEALTTEPVYTKTVGFLIVKNQHGYVLATDIYDNLDDYNTKIFIPKGMVTKVEILKAP